MFSMVTNGSGSGLKFFKIILFQHGTTELYTSSLAPIFTLAAR